jgi:ABC-2 type transport system permease protein
MKRLSAFARFVGAYVNANLQGALEYRASFASQVFTMLVNDAMWVTFWLAYFDKFKVVAGWGRSEIVMLWAVVAAGFGLGMSICGNANRIATMIARGELDFYLPLPKPVLPHALISRMNLTAPGDILFGVLVFGVVVHPSPVQWALFGLFTVTTALILVAAQVIAHSLAFWLGNAEGIAQLFENALIMFSTYPTGIFEGWVKVLLFTVIPAGFIGFVPVQLLREPSLPLLLGLIAFCAGVVAASIALFRLGLERYESGNLMTLRD